MSITANTYNIVEIPSEGNEWDVSLYSADISGCEDIKAAEAGKSHYLKRIEFRCATEMTVSIGSGETTGSVTTIHLGPIPFDAASGIFVKTFRGKGLKCTSGLALTIDSSAEGPIAIFAEGKTCRDILPKKP